MKPLEDVKPAIVATWKNNIRHPSCSQFEKKLRLKVMPMPANSAPWKLNILPV